MPIKIQRSRVCVLFICLALLLIYSNSFHVPFIFDDNGSISENETIRSLKTAFFPQGNSGVTVSGRPVLNFTLAVNYALGKEDVEGYHIGNLLIHFLAAVTLFGLVRRTLLLPGMRLELRNASCWIALIVAALWSMHPLQTESVTYIIQRAESLVGLFYLLTLYFFVRAVASSEVIAASTGPVQKLDKRWLIASVLTCLIGMGSKEVMAGAPLVVLLYDRAFVSGSIKDAWRSKKIFYIALAVTWLLLVACIYWTGQRGATVGYDRYATWWRYIMTQGVAIMHYLKLIFWPYPQVLDYGQALALDYREAVWQSIAVFLLLLTSLFLLWKRPKIGFLCACFFILLAPSSSFVPVLTQTMAEHRMYLPLIAVVVLVVVIVHYKLGGVGLGVLASLMVILGALTYLRNFDYRTEENIWKTVTKRCPYNARGWGALTVIYLKQDNLEQARDTAREGLKYTPENLDMISQYAAVLMKMDNIQEAKKWYEHVLERNSEHPGANGGLGEILLKEKKYEEAIARFEKTLRVNPHSYWARYHMGKAYSSIGRLDKALDCFQTLLVEDPNMPDTRNNVASVLINLGRFDDAISVLEDGIKINSDIPILHGTLGLALFSLGRVSESINEYKITLKLDGNDSKAHSNLALAYEQQGKAKEALEHYEAAIKHDKEAESQVLLALHVSAGNLAAETGNLSKARAHYAAAVALDKDGNPELHYTLANLLMRENKNEEAALHYEYVVRLMPEYAQAQYELGVAYARLGRIADAVRILENALKIQPGFAEARTLLEQLKQSP